MATSRRPSLKRTVRRNGLVKPPVVAIRSAGRRISRRAFLLERKLHVRQVKTITTLWRLHMRYLLMILCFFCATSVASARPLPYRSHPTTLNVFDPLPASVRTISMADYTRWAKSHNKLAYEKAEDRAREFNKRHPRSSITVITTEYEGSPMIEYGHRGGRTTTRRGMIRQTQRTYRQPPWDGGPVVIINPYFRPTGN